MQRRERNIILVWMLAVTDCLYLVLVISTLGDVHTGMMSSMNLTGGQKCLQWHMTRKFYSIKVVYFFIAFTNTLVLQRTRMLPHIS